MRVFGVAGLAIVGSSLVGCYTLQPTSAPAPVLGQRMAFDVNDAGRAALGGSMGPEIGQIEGQLVQQNPSEYIVAVTTVRFLRGGEQPWSGETVHLKSEYVTQTYVRRFAAGRTIALGALGAGAVAVIATTALNAGGQPTMKPPPDTAATSISPRP